MPLTVAVKLICHLLVLREGWGGVLREATNVSIYCGANFPYRPLSVSSSRSHNLRQSSVMFAADKWLGGTALRRGGEMKARVICFWVVKARRSTGRELPPPVPRGWWRRGVCMFTFDLCTCVSEREAEAAAGCEETRVKQLLNWITF